MARTSTRTDGQVTGKVGRVSGDIGAGLTGEVMLPIRGGSEAFNAFPHVGTDEFKIGDLVVVEKYVEPRIVYVSAAK